MPNQYLQILWELWKYEIIDVSQVIKALKIYEHTLSYIGNSGLKTLKNNIQFEFKYEKR